MGIPKFFRYISERYPLTSQLIEENQIPEFDNLYLDFNSIIHNCSHPNDEDAHFRLSEEAIFTAIFTYVDHLFGKIKPKKLFFMAVDGVAPRAKMNQQRGRRFRTAKEAKEVREKALRKGEKLPDEKAFDSNCITPGTEFMARLSAQLKWFVNKKISEDANWRDVEVVLSGHDVPGEGEHKIMEYIRLSKAQPDYNPNVRHCLYGLDADLIMLGLLSHDPHFCLLREEVKFGPARKKNSTTLETMNFYLLHICLMREYLDLEFREVASSLPFDYNLERIIDDFILLAVFVGNDFLPNLPDIHIHENGLERLFEIYKKVLPSMGGYMQESGTIDTKRLQLVLDEMVIWERDVFQKEYGDMNWFKGKQAKYVDDMENARKRNKLVLTKPQRDIFDKVKAFVSDNQTPAQMRGAQLAMANTFPARERKFIGTLASDLKLDLAWDEYDEQDQNLVIFRFPGFGFGEREQESGGAQDEANGDLDSDDAEEDAEARSAVDRVLKKYERADVMLDSEEDFDKRHEASLKEKMDAWKGDYYQGKLGFAYDNTKALGDLVYRYVEGLQWVMHYYYSGVTAWGWFYDYHYAPRISDLKGVDQMTFNFALGRPFRPYEQLMGVLPEASKELIPLAYRDLMYDVNSPILDFYPVEFEQDMNGKKAEWEAIVKIPFIDEKRLLSAMSSREHRLTKEEVRRNAIATSTRFIYKSEPTVYESPLPFFPTLHRCYCQMEDFNLPTLDGLHLVPGLCDGVFLGSHALAGFPSLQTLPHSAMLGHHGVNVHGSESRNRSMVVHIQNPYEGKKTAEIAKEMVGKRVYMGWPFLQEGEVVAVSDSLFKHEKVSFGYGEHKVLGNPHQSQGLVHWRNKAERIQEVYSKRCGVITGDIDVLLHIRPLKGLKRLDSGAFTKEYEGFDKEVERALQMVVAEVTWEDARFIEREAPPLSEEFPDGSKIFFLGEHAYGVAAQVSSTTDNSLSVVLAFLTTDKAENEKFTSIVANRAATQYYPAFKVAEMVGLSGLGLSKITSSFMALTSRDEKVNLGLSIKFEAKSLKVIDYSRKNGRYWEFSDKAIDLLREYKAKYPEVFVRLGGSGDQMTRAEDIFPEENADTKVKEIRTWLNSKGVRDFEAVSLFCDQLKKDTVAEIEKLADEFGEAKKTATFRKAMVQKIPREAVLKPSHSVYRLQNQSFGLGDRVTMVQDTGGVPLAARGVVIGLNAKSMDVVWDIPFLSGTTLGDRCSPYRGSTVTFDSCLNLTNPQFVMSTKPNVPHPPHPQVPFQPRIGPRPAVAPASGQQAASGFRPSPQTNGRRGAVHIMANPDRGRGAAPAFPGRGRPLAVDSSSQADTAATAAPATHVANGNGTPAESSDSPQPNGVQPRPAQQHPRGGFNGPVRGGFRGHPRGGFVPNFRGRGGFGPDVQARGRGMPPPRGGFRGRGRGFPGQGQAVNSS